MIITIDGPVASGKSTVAKALAKELHIYYLYTGLLYRAMGCLLLEQAKKEKNRDLSLEEFKKYLEDLTPAWLEFVKEIAYDYGKDGAKDGDEDRPYVFYKGVEITDRLSDRKVDQLASIVSANPHVREALLSLQRDVATRYDIVADGRDCGSVVFPDAEHKIYLTASEEVRAQRLMLDDKRGKFGVDLETAKADLQERDTRDRERAVAPLTIPKDATIIDGSDMTIKGTVDHILKAIEAGS